MNKIKQFARLLLISSVAALMVLSSLSGCVVVDKVVERVPEATVDAFKACSSAALKQCLKEAAAKPSHGSMPAEEEEAPIPPLVK
jgi:hypothetical protein